MKRERRRVEEARTSLNIKKRMFFIVIILALAFVFVQFLKLSTIGRIGNKISQVKQEQERLELENELLKAEISKLRSPSNLEEALPGYGEFSVSNVKVLSVDAYAINVIAQD